MKVKGLFLAWIMDAHVESEKGCGDKLHIILYYWIVIFLIFEYLHIIIKNSKVVLFGRPNKYDAGMNRGIVHVKEAAGRKETETGNIIIVGPGFIKQQQETHVGVIHVGGLPNKLIRCTKAYFFYVYQ
ncbi:hypothetical protein BDA99DRAFT_541959 [Phascolomyces articulosus]|uniref:Uncharacterized protein n=1 Tax=Phascolomyces articulosus TaxID=60185 RepID=A0AAD5JQX8_9FUNG|nr:hypothetical protein BDA99DRAFT_541959 [Phascolomyces articulosus]